MTQTNVSPLPHEALNVLDINLDASAANAGAQTGRPAEPAPTIT
jgi:hypothetical protein